tara:strand:+ start:690 stop:968 length:279 start_codon:yes stop_codon:yes gene_type:complete
MEDFELYNTIVNNPIYLSITVLLAVLVIYSALKKFIKWLIVALICFVGYLGFLYISGDQQTINDVDQMIDTGKEKVQEILKDQIQNQINEDK